jgi:hypothetical protein
MSVIEPPLTNRPYSSPADEELDGLLRSFFRDELPQPWPALTPPVASVLPLPPAAPTHSAFLSSSRVALAASVALLVGGQAWLYHSHKTEAVPSPGNSAAGGLLARPDLHGKKAQGPGAAVTAKENAPRSAPVKPMR